MGEKEVYAGVRCGATTTLVIILLMAVVQITFGGSHCIGPDMLCP